MEVTNHAASVAYIGELWPDGLPDDSGLVLCADARSSGVWLSDIPQVAQALLHGGHQFVRSTASKRPAHGRGGNDLAVALPGFHCDVDCLHGLHRSLDLPTLEQAKQFIAELPLAPTLILETGGGLLVWWLFKEPWVLEDAPEQSRAHLALKGWQGFIQDLAAAKGWHVDGTSDLARLVRIEGTLNQKYDPPRLVERIEGGGPRWNPSDFEEWRAPERDSKAQRSGAGQHASATPKEISRDVRRVLDRLALNYRIKAASGGEISAIILQLCPACGGLERRGSIARETAHLGPRTGRLHCKRETCDACVSGGVPLWTWVSLWAPGALPFIDKGAALFPEGVPRVSFVDALDALMRLLEEAIKWVRETRGIAVLVVPPGAGKTTALLRVMRNDPRIVYFGRNYDELAEKMREYGGAAAMREGIATACTAPGRAVAEQVHVLRGWRGTACRGCGERDQCGVWKALDPNVPIFAPHQADEPMSLEGGPTSAGLHDFEDAATEQPARAGRLAVYDECPPVVHTTRLGADDLANLELSAVADDATSQEQRRLAVSLERVLLDAIHDVERRVAEASKRDPKAVFTAYEQVDLLALITQGNSSTGDEKLLGLTTDELRCAAELPDNLFAVPSADERWSGTWAAGDGAKQYAHDDALPILRALATLALVPPGLLGKTDPVAGRLRVCVDASGKGRVELRRPRPLAVPNGALVLDATGYIEIEALQRANPERPVRAFCLDLEPAEGAEIRRVWIVTSSATRRSLFEQRQLKQPAVKLVGHVFDRIAAHAQEVFGTSASVGLISHAPLQGAFKLAVEGEGPLAPLLAKHASALGFSADHLGYFGHDERGSNAFIDVGVLVTFGDPWPTIGDAEACGRALQLRDPRTRASTQAHASLAQAVGRAREVRGGRKLLVHVGKLCPAGWLGRCELELLDLGRPPKAEREAYLEVCRHLLAGQGWASTWAVEAVMALELQPEGVGRNLYREVLNRSFRRPPPAGSSGPMGAPGAHRTRREWVKEGGRQFSAVQVQVPLPCRTVWARPDADVRQVQREAIRLWWRLHPDGDSPGADFGQRLWSLLGGVSTDEPPERLQGLLVDWVAWAEERAAAYQVDERLQRAAAVQRAGDEAEERVRRQVVIALLLLARGGLSATGQAGWAAEASCA